MFKRISLSFFVAIVLAFYTYNSQAVTSYCVMDLKTGTVLDSKNLHKQIYPASLTKMMVFYIVLKSLKEGRIALADVLYDFETKYAKKGFIIDLSSSANHDRYSISIFEILNALMTYSLNNAGWILAEEIYGKHGTFLNIMNNQAAQMNMTKTKLANLDGLFHASNVSTAYDMAILLKKIYDDFYEYLPIMNGYIFFKNGKSYEKASMIDRDMVGIVATKTGFISQSGQNIATIFEKGNKKIGIVVIGANSDYIERNIYVGELLAKNLSQSDIVWNMEQKKMNQGRNLLEFIKELTK